MQDKDTVAMDN